MFGKVYNKIYSRKNWTDVFELTICSFLCLLKIILMVSNSIQFFHNLIFVVFIPSYCTCCFVNSFIFWADISKGIGLFYTLLVLFCWLADFQSCYFARNWVGSAGGCELQLTSQNRTQSGSCSIVLCQYIKTNQTRPVFIEGTRFGKQILNQTEISVSDLERTRKLVPSALIWRPNQLERGLIKKHRRILCIDLLSFEWVTCYTCLVLIRAMKG